MGEVIPFEQPVEHDPATTIVEKLEMTPELKQAFEDAGYDMESVG